MQDVLFKIIKSMSTFGITGCPAKLVGIYFLNRKFTVENPEIKTFRLQVFIITINF